MSRARKPVDNNEMISLSKLGSHRREYRIWKKKRRGNLSTGKGMLCGCAKWFLCLLEWQRLLVLAIEAKRALRRQAVT